MLQWDKSSEVHVGVKYWLFDWECSDMDEVADLLTIMRAEKKNMGDFFLIAEG